MTRMALLFLSICMLTLGACTPTIANRGNMVEDEQMAKIKTGFHTRSDVLRYLGSPTTVAPFDDNLWYYIGQETEKRGILDPEVIDEKIVEVAFDDSGVVQKVATVDAQRLDVPLSRDKTRTNGNDFTVMQQFLGNLGRFNTQSQ